MKKLTRSQRNRLKKRKEVIAAATANGEDVEEALTRAGLVEQKNTTTQGEGKQEKARKRIERLKKNKMQVVEDGGPSGEVYEDVLWKAYAATFGYKDTVRESSGLVQEIIHPSSPIPVSALERTLMESEPSTWTSMFATPPPMSDPPIAQPSAVFLSPSAVGALDCLKSCQTFHKGCHIAKLFAKHIKVVEQVDYISKNPICIALGTPNRIVKLASDAHIAFTKLRYLILDMRENKKKQTLVDIPDIAADFWNLWNTFLSPLCSSSGTHRMQFKILIVV